LASSLGGQVNYLVPLLLLPPDLEVGDDVQEAESANG
jgi:hypothetical protein